MNTQLESLLELGEVLLENNGTGQHILFLSVIGEIEGHHLSSDRIKTTKYEHLLPLLTQVQDNQEIDGLFLLINTVGGDCSCGLAAAEMIASIKKPTVSLVIGDSHSIGVPLSVAADRTFIAPTATMILHPVRLNGTIIGAPQTFEYFRLIQDSYICRSTYRSCEKQAGKNDDTSGDDGKRFRNNSCRKNGGGRRNY